ncbi:unnamed protein product (macronuclear) [Paramecium tetraurelia]|uniref:Alpha-1,3-glucosyltransferase n=1 Tax=Paramecium tetraurelia TaxID=5888 RepID=A0BQ13_PARTE|nr:uncharacterized protein GSPATT00005381001 [Paramecium tetraurelia]CAK60630.1 unnamed protein product [Paramecium tetraurelia]|eukprot:XP_001428028.1 hypothetical protein (macronuclear) [Paramecium tetraurelia strain d4-2]
MYLIILVVLIKCMLINLYYSTDFDVHRNWMRVTTEQPINQWYYDEQSIWTLDYPPLFAYLEYLFGKIAILLGIDLYNITDSLVWFQRITVIVSEFLYFFAVKKQQKSFTKQFIDMIPFGCLLIDNIHFQYNGFLYGILLFICYKLQQQQYLQASLLYVILLSFKHIYIYVLPAFGVILLKNCQIKQIISIGILSASLLLVIFLPFYQDIFQILKRLFPFQRGLVHAYWAQNFWSIYCAADKVLGAILKINKASTASGVVQETVFNVLPSIGNITTLIIIGSLCLLLFRKKYKNVYDIFTISSLIFFNFGYHVHEKAVMIPIILQFVQMKNPNLMFMASFINGIALLPLIPTSYEQPILIILLIIFHTVFYAEYQITLNNAEKLYLYAGGLVIFYDRFLHHLIFEGRLEFLPLITYSLYGSLFNQYWLIKQLRQKDDYYVKLC